MENLLPGKYTICITGLSGDAYLESAHLGTTDVLKHGLKVSSAPPVGKLELVVSPFGASVEGVVSKMESPVIGAYIVIETTDAEGGQRNANTETQSDQYGHFVFHALPAGEYTLSIREDEQSSDLRIIRLSLHERQHSTVSVTLDSAE